MRATATVFALLLSMPGLAAAQDWEEYVSRQDGFSINFPGQPKIAETTWTVSVELHAPGTCLQRRARPGALLHHRRRLRLTRAAGDRALEGVPAGNAQCRDGGPTIGPGYWKQDERGALVYAVSKFLRPPFQVTYYAWDWQDMVEGTSLQLNSTDGRRTLVYVAMHERKLYILEGSVPEGRPEPGLFQQSLGWLDKEGTESATRRRCTRIPITVLACTPTRTPHQRQRAVGRVV